MALVVLSGKVTPEVSDQFKEAQANSEAQTHNQFLELLLEAFLNPKIKMVEVPTPTAEQAEALQLLQNEIGRLNIELDFKKEEITALGEECRLLEKQLSETKEQNVSAVLYEPSAYEVLLKIPPIVAMVLDKEAAAANKKSGSVFTRQDILLNSFWESIENGRSYPFLVWSNSELSAIKKQLQSAE